jgi:hypothetical protein
MEVLICLIVFFMFCTGVIVVLWRMGRTPDDS